jgi:Rad3-related DNA helicase
MGMVSLKGMRNYKCDMKPEDPDYTCEEGRAARCMYNGTVGCKLSAAEMAAASSSLVVSNYSKWTSSKKFGLGMGHFAQVMFDEGHNMPEELSKAVQVVLSPPEINDKLLMDFPSPHEAEDDMLVWKRWAQVSKERAEEMMLAARARITGVSNPKTTHVKHYSHMRNLCRRLNILATVRVQDWVVEEIRNGPIFQGYKFDPIRPARYAESCLFMHTDSVVAVSATIRPKTGYMCGVAAAITDFHEYPSEFDPARSPVYYLPATQVRRGNSMDQIWLKHDQFAAMRQDRLGLVHTVSHQRREEIMSFSRFAERMEFNERGENVAHAIERWQSRYPGGIFVTPSVEEGYDFAFKQCEWQFLCRIPFEPPSKILKAREADDKEYRPYTSVQRLVQAVGRIMRDKRDQGESLICDAQMDWFWPRWSYLAPKSFNRIFIPVSRVPPPPPRLD